MNTNKPPAPLPLWRRRQYYEVTIPGSVPDRPAAPQPDIEMEPGPDNAQISTTADPDPNPSLPAISTPRPKRIDDRHKRKCVICHHREREAIDEAFLRWLHPNEIVREFNLPSRSALYRHADATGLLALRRRSMHRVLDRIIERVDSAPITGNNVLRAIILNTRFTDDGAYAEPPKRTEIAYIDERNEPISNRDTLRLETSVTPTK